MFLQKVRQALSVIKDKRVGVLGLAFEADTDDIRFAPSLEVIRRLRAEGARMSAYDPQAIGRTQQVFPEIAYTRDAYEVADCAEAILVLTPWKEFRDLDWKRIGSLMARPLVVDGRNLLDPSAMRHLGFEFYSVGRPDSCAPILPIRHSGVTLSVSGSREPIPIPTNSVLPSYGVPKV